MALIRLDEPTTKRIPPDTFSLWALAFRPFYLLAALFAAIAVPVWAVAYSGAIELPMPGIWWHAHEMIFGFAIAVIIGFLFTAGRNWTGLDTPTDKPLMVLAAVWLAGRLAMAFGSGAWVAIVDLAFLPVAAGMLLKVLIKAKSKRNYFVGALPAMLALANLFFHLAVLGVIEADPLTAMHLALGLVVVLETIVGGRVIPMFTFNAVRGVKQWRNVKLDWAAAIATGIALLLWALGAGAWAGVVSLVAAALQAVRLGGWNPWATRSQPILWVLQLAYLWIPLGLALVALTQFGVLPRSALAIHPRYAAFDAEARFGLAYTPVADHKACECGPILRGIKAPLDCKLFGTVCTPETPMGACMVSSEGACAAHYTYGRVRDGSG